MMLLPIVGEVSAKVGHKVDVIRVDGVRPPAAQGDVLNMRIGTLHANVSVTKPRLDTGIGSANRCGFVPKEGQRPWDIRSEAW